MSEVKLFQGDCTEILPKVCDKDQKYCIVSDPPFNIGYHYNTYKDRMKEDEYISWLSRLFSLVKSCVVIHYPEKLHSLSIAFNTPPQSSLMGI